jgi:hypothetical protein
MMRVFSNLVKVDGFKRVPGRPIVNTYLVDTVRIDQVNVRGRSLPITCRSSYRKQNQACQLGAMKHQLTSTYRHNPCPCFFCFLTESNFDYWLFQEKRQLHSALQTPTLDLLVGLRHSVLILTGNCSRPVKIPALQQFMTKNLLDSSPGPKRIDSWSW